MLILNNRNFPVKQSILNDFAQRAQSPQRSVFKFDMIPDVLNGLLLFITFLTLDFNYFLLYF
ncbi:MAG TPA: hypothetical protein DC049_01665 [Spirochaetia bacterium]|nr:hypothetical protein [Spirochaetia bacterium]